MKLFFALRGFEVIMKKIRPEEVVNIDIIKSASALYVQRSGMQILFTSHAPYIHSQLSSNALTFSSP